MTHQTASAAPVRTPAGVDRRIRLGALAAAVAGLAICAAGLAADPGRLSFAWVWAFAFTWTVVVGCLFFVGLQHLTSSLWSVVVRRVAEAVAAQAWLVAILFLPLLAFVLVPEVFPAYPWADPRHVASEALLIAKAPYLNVPFFAARGLFFVVAWAAFARYFVGRSLAQDRGVGGDAATLGMRRVAPVFTLVFAVTVTFAGLDWLMTLAPEWFSTIFGVYVFAGMFATALAVITLGVLGLRAAGRLGDGLVGEAHLFTLGALMFGMTCFWAYIAFSQYMLIWYGNLPEETGYVATRFNDGWLPWTVALAFLRFFVPFALLLGRWAKVRPAPLAAAAAIIVAGELVDLFWIVMPQATPAGPSPSWIDLGPLLATTGALAFLVARFLDRHPAVAVGDPLLSHSVAAHA